MSTKEETILTTNEEDQAEVAKLQARLAQSIDPSDTNDEATTNISSAWVEIPNVRMDEGTHKYVLISAVEPRIRENNSIHVTQHFVTSKCGAAYHRNAVEPFVYDLENHGYTNIRVKGGGRIDLDHNSKRVNIFGYSYGFGQANHEISKQVVISDDLFCDYDVTWSNEGY